jgi:hypothetical protein
MSRFKQVRHRISAAAAAAAALAAVSCSGGPQPTADLVGARTLVAQAEQSDAQQFDSADLEAARSELQQADQDARAQPQLAIRLARQSTVDAELALARTRALKAEQALRQINADNATLQSESEREHPAATPPLPPVSSATTPYQ